MKGNSYRKFRTLPVRLQHFSSVVRTGVLLLGFGAGILSSCSPSEPERGAERLEITPNPCLEPVRWRIGQVDERFGMSAEQVRTMVETAAQIWEKPSGRRFFVYDAVDGLPIHLVYDERQATTVAQRAQGEELSLLKSAVEEREQIYERARREYENARYAHEQLALDLRERIRAHNRAVEAWNTHGGSPEMHGRLQVDASRIEQDRSDLDRAAEELEELRRRAEAAATELQEAVDRHQDAVREYHRANPQRRIHSGMFKRNAETRGGRRVEVRSSLTVFQFNDTNHLLLVLAHELGHALGLEHVDEPLAVMRETHAAENLGERVRLQQADVEALIRRCGAGVWMSTKPVGADP